MNNQQANPVRFYRDRRNGRLMGVCAGLADYFGLSIRGTRIVFVIIALMSGFTPIFVAYLVLGFILPEKPADLYDESEQEEFWRDVRTNPAATAHNLRQKFRDLERRLRAAEAHITDPRNTLAEKIRNL